MTKGEKQRHIYLTNKKVIAALSEYIHSIRIKEQELFNFNAPLFKTQRGSRFQPDVLQKWFRKIYDKAGLVGASSHSGRRTFITRLIEQGADIKAVSRLAGHAHIATTSEYVEDNPDRLKHISSLALL
jgi:integrase/recombinase XerD